MGTWNYAYYARPQPIVAIPEADAAGAGAVVSIPIDAMLLEDGTPMLFEDGSYMLYATSAMLYEDGTPMLYEDGTYMRYAA